MALEKLIYDALEKPVFRALYWITAVLLLVWGGVGGGSFLWEVLTEGELKTDGNLESYWKALVWLALVLAWIFIYRLLIKYSREREVCQIRWEFVSPDRLDLEPEKWDSAFKTHFEAEFSKWGIFAQTDKTVH